MPARLHPDPPARASTSWLLRDVGALGRGHRRRHAPAPRPWATRMGELALLLAARPVWLACWLLGMAAARPAGAAQPASERTPEAARRAWTLLTLPRKTYTMRAARMRYERWRAARHFTVRACHRQPDLAVRRPPSSAEPDPPPRHWRGPRAPPRFKALVHGRGGAAVSGKLPERSRLTAAVLSVVAPAGRPSLPVSVAQVLGLEDRRRLDPSRPTLGGRRTATRRRSSRRRDWRALGIVCEPRIAPFGAPASPRNSAPAQGGLYRRSANGVSSCRTTNSSLELTARQPVERPSFRTCPRPRLRGEPVDRASSRSA
jgi:hypothetical protein